MADAAAAKAPPPAAAAPAASVGDKGDPRKEPEKAAPETPFKFKVVQNGKFSIDHLLVNGTLEATLEFNSELQATYRTMTADEIQACEALVDDAMRRERSAKYVMNELTIGQLYYSLVAINGKAIPEPSGEYRVNMDAGANKRRDFIRKLPGPLFDLIVAGLNEFDKHSKAVVTKEGVANF